MKTFFKIIFYSVLTIVFIIILGFIYLKVTNEPHWHLETNAIKSESHPYAGFWKSENCNNDWGWAIGPANENTYYISFCGPGGCFKEGTYRPNTTIINDEKYKIIDENTIQAWSEYGWHKHVRCASRT